jgi:hypothetical protein
MGKRYAEELMKHHGDEAAKAFAHGAISGSGAMKHKGAHSKVHAEGIKMGKKYVMDLAKQHGDKFAKAFTGGCMYGSGVMRGDSKHYTGGGWFDWYDNIDWTWNWDDFAQGFRDGFNATRNVLGYAAPILDMIEPGLGTAVTAANKGLDYLGVGHPMKGGHCPSEEHLRAEVSGKGTKKGMMRKTARRAYEGMEGSKKRRAPAAANDGRRARAEIVKKVMAEKGLNMIAASQYVKAQGLY